MNYDEMSDFEINKAVAEASGGYGGIADIGGDAVCAYDAEYGVSFYTERDYCSNWSDAGAIITDNKISIIFDHKQSTWKASVPFSFGGHTSAYDTNPLRAAMVVYLKMKDAENANTND